MSDFAGALKSADEHPDFKLAVIGVPFDEKSSFRRGAAGGPAAIRAASTGKCYNPCTELGVDLEYDTVLVDLGDVDTSGDVDKTFARTEQAVARVLERKAVPIVLGGDHSITLHAVRAVAKHYPALDVLHFDAHPDLYTDLYGDRLSHACPMMRIMEDGLAKTLVQVGIRAASRDQRANAAKVGARMVEMKDFREPLVLEFRNPLYISFDLDALDPAFAPGVSHPEPGGLSTRQAVAVIQGLKAGIVGFDIVELNAARDPSGITAAAAFKLLKELAGRVVRP